MTDRDDLDLDLDLFDHDELAELRALADRFEPIVPAWQEAPAGLWERIAAEAGVDPGARPAPEAPPVDRGPAVTPGLTDLDAARERRAATAEVRPNHAGPSASSRRPGAMPPWMLVAAAVLAVLAVGAVALTALRGGDDASGEVLAASELELLVDRGSGRAELVDRDGALELRVDLTDLDPGDGFLEVWMIDTEVSKLVSLGPVRDDGVYSLPSGMDPAAFPIVDVSVEPFDGDPTHSGASVLRGQLEV